jgi:hypothetical protein
MDELRIAEGNEFTHICYQALVPVQYPGGVAGIARLITNNTIGAARIGANVWYSTDNSDTVVHEIGHNQGLRHIACPGGNSAGNDGSYPDPSGLIMQLGFGIKKFELYNPAATFDYMTYCGPSWVSDWTWNKTFWRILELTSWDYGGGAVAPDDPEPMLRGIVDSQGETQWWVAHGEIDAERTSGNHVLTFDVGGTTVETLATAEPLSDGHSMWIEAPLPAELSRIDGFAYRGRTLGSVDVSAEISRDAILGR